MIGSYTNIFNYYTDIYRLKKYGTFSVAEINKMTPYEMEIYSLLLLKDIQEENKKNGQKKKS